MPWNEPGGSGNNNDPWNNKKDQGPPDFDKLIGEWLKKIRSAFLGKKSNMPWKPTMNQEVGFVAAIVASVAVVIWFFSGLFIVNPAEEAVILRLGQFADVVHPGLHWYARFIETKSMVDVQKIYSFSLQDDFLTKSSDQSDLPNQYIKVDSSKKASPDVSDQSKNLVNVELSVQYRISDPRAYLFNVVDPDGTIKEVATGALSDMVGQMKLDEVLTTGREMLSSGVLERIKTVLGPYHSGIEVMAVTLRKVQAPDQVRAAFSDVNRADQDKATFIQQAQAYASKVVPLAQGEAARIIANATGYQQQSVLNAQANIAKYQALAKVYATSPIVTRERMYLDTMQTILQNTSKVLVDVNGGNNLIYLPLDKIIQQGTDVDTAKQVAPQALPSYTSNHSDSTVNPTTNGEVKNDTN